jgi:iron complex transport system substrate-binding protein
MTRTPLQRAASLAALAMLVLTACSSSAPTSGLTTPSDEADATNPTDVVAGTDRGDDLRIVTDSEVVAGHLASVGLLPAGALDGVDEWLQPYADAGLLDDDVDLSAISSAGSEDGLDLERVAALDPDLILIEEFSADLEPQLSAIAPTTVISRPTNADWKAAFEQVVEATGREEQAQAVVDRYESVLAEAPATEDELITFIRGAGPGEFRLDVLGGFGGSVAEEAGFTVDVGGATAEEAAGGTVNFSNENLDVVSGTLLVTTTQEAGGPSNIDELIDSPLWTGIPAVADGRVIELPQSIYNGGTYVAAELLLQAVYDGLQR